MAGFRRSLIAGGNAKIKGDVGSHSGIFDNPELRIMLQQTP
jgi:hypothetical protein